MVMMNRLQNNPLGCWTISVLVITCLFGAFLFGARQFDACQFGAFQFGAMPVWRVSLWRVSHFFLPKLHRSVSTSVWHVSRFAPMLIEYGEYGVARVRSI